MQLTLFPAALVRRWLPAPDSDQSTTEPPADVPCMDDVAKRLIAEHREVLEALGDD